MRAGKIFSAAVLSVLLFGTGCVGPGREGGAAGQAPDFSLKDLNGTEQSLGGLLKIRKAVLINFWATWCPPCREEIPDLIRLQGRYGDRGFTVLGVDVGESQAKVAAFVKKIGINYPVVLDEDSAVAERYGIVGIPTSLLVNSEGRIVGEYHAATPELFADVEEAIK